MDQTADCLPNACIFSCIHNQCQKKLDVIFGRDNCSHVNEISEVVEARDRFSEAIAIKTSEKVQEIS